MSLYVAALRWAEMLIVAHVALTALFLHFGWLSGVEIVCGVLLTWARTRSVLLISA